MQKITRLIPLILSFLILFSACSKSSESIRYIPKDAIGVVSLNTVELGKKVLWSAVSGSPVFKEMTGKNGDSTKFDFEKTGIEPLTTFFAFGLPDQRLAGKSKFMVILPLKDAAKFKAFLLENYPKAKTEQKDKLTFISIDDNTCIGFDKQTAIAATSSRSSEYEWNDDGTRKERDNSQTLTILIEEVQKTFNLPKDQSIAENKQFMSLMKENHDFSFWLNYEALANGLPQGELGDAGTVLASQKKLLKDAFISGGLDFEKGKIVADAKYYFNSTNKGIAMALESKSSNAELLKKIPGSQLNLLMSYHINPQGIKALVDTMGMAPLANMGLKEIGLTMDDILNSFTGDFLFTITDFAVHTKSLASNVGGSAVNYTSPEPSMKAFLSFKIKDQAAFSKLVQTASGKELMMMTGPDAYVIGSGIYLSKSGDYVAVSNDNAAIANFVSGTVAKDFSVPAEVKNNPYGLYIDIKNSIQSLPLDLLYGKEDTAVFHDGKKLMESVIAYGGKVEGDHSSFHFEANFQNKDENSLTQIINFSQKVMEANKREADSFDDVIPDADTTEAVEVTDTVTPAI
jgi:hypothetical protein